MAESITSVYRLSGILDDPRYSGFFSPHGRFLRTVGPPWTTRNWKVKRVSSEWQPAKLRGKVRKANDFPVIDLGIPAFSERAANGLRDILEKNGELLPISSERGSYFAYNVTTVADVLNREESDIKWMKNDFIATMIDRFEFFPNKLKDLAIFRIPEKPLSVFVTNIFVDRVNNLRLCGFDFQLVWPCKRGVHWMILAKQRRREREGSELSPGKSLKGESVFIRFNPQSAPLSKVQMKEVAERLRAEVEDLMHDEDSIKPAIGALERWYECQESDDICLPLSCPDAEALIERLRPWLKDVNKRGELTIIKRSGNFADRRAAQEVLDTL